MKRGIIAAPCIIAPKVAGFEISPTLTAEDIRFFILYWDKIIIPTNNVIHLGIPDEEDLIACGAIWRPRVELKGRISGEDILKGQSEVAQLMMKDKSTDWVMHQTGDQFHILPEDIAIKNVIRINLTGSLPVPRQEVNINEVLEFKDRRMDELRALHNALDEIYFDVLRSPDSNLAELKAVDRLKKDILNLNKVSSEKFKTDKKFDLSAEFNITGKNLAAWFAAGALLDPLLFSSGILVSGVFAAAASTIKISLKSSKTFTYAGDNTRLSYLSKARKENILV